MINYIDCGLHEGNEIEIFLEQTRGLDVRVIGIEANSFFSNRCEKRFADEKAVEIHNFAVADKDGFAMFYFDMKCGEGSSLYKDKKNLIDAHYVETPTIQLSKWLTKQGIIPKKEGDINIIRANIEGAEWMLINDFSENNVFKHFDYFLGVFGWLNDMRKVPSLENLVDSAQKILTDNNVEVQTFVGPSETYPTEEIMKDNFDFSKLKGE